MGAPTENSTQDMVFECPKCGKISRDNVLFLCNTCSQTELIELEGVYMCPACLRPGENFECMQCGSKQVTLIKGVPQKSA